MVVLIISIVYLLLKKNCNTLEYLSNKKFKIRLMKFDKKDPTDFHKLKELLELLVNKKNY